MTDAEDDLHDVHVFHAYSIDTVTLNHLPLDIESFSTVSLPLIDFFILLFDCHGTMLVLCQRALYCVRGRGGVGEGNGVLLDLAIGRTQPDVREARDIGSHPKN